jgi:hypothetical protein
MSAARPPAALADRLRRILAAGGVALVLALTVLAASPAAHAWLHSHEEDHADHPATVDVDTCAVAMFANGVSPDLGQPALGAPVAVVRAIALTTADGIFLVSPRYLRQPERGPPQGLVG